MADTLVLMRHGKAKAAAASGNDFDRELSEAGKRALAASLPDMLSFAASLPGPIQVWASPAARTVQTANLLASALKRAGVKAEGPVASHDSLWEQDDVAFLEEVVACDAHTVIAVGHNPMVEQLVADLAAARIPFSTGAIAAIRLAGPPPAEGAVADEGAVSAGGAEAVAGPAASGRIATRNETGNRLLWFVQGPISQLWRTLVQMEKTIAGAADNVQARLSAFYENPDDIETMHKFRVSIRTLRSLLAFVRPWQDAKQNAAMQADLKEVVGVTSRLRELDVLAGQARESGASSAVLVAFLEERAAEERVRVAGDLAGKRLRRLLERACGQAHDIRWKRRLNCCGLPAAAVRGRFDDMAARLESDLAGLDLALVEPTHDVRKSAKRVRYAAENFKGLIGEDAVGIARGMTAHQDALGAVCDARVNIDIVNAFQAEPGIPDEVAWDLALLRAENETYLYTTLRNAKS